MQEPATGSGFARACFLFQMRPAECLLWLASVVPGLLSGANMTLATLQNDDEDNDGAELRGPGEPSTSGRENGAHPVSNGGWALCLLLLKS